MSITLATVVNSETMTSQAFQIFDNNNNLIGSTLDTAIANLNDFDDIPFNMDNRILRTYSINTNKGRRWIQALLRGEITRLVNMVRNDIDEFFHPTLLQVKVQGVSVQNVQGLSIRTEKRVKDMLKPIENNQIQFNFETGEFIAGPSRSYVKPETILQRYKIFGTIKNIPYTNYLNNNVPEGVNCFYNFIKDTYKRISKLEKYNKGDGVSIEDIQNFTNKYKIPCKLLNIAGRMIYKNDFERNKNHPALNAIISNHHIYPLNKDHYTKYHNVKPLLNKSDLKEEINKEIGVCDDIFISENNKYYTINGVTIDDTKKLSQIDIDNEFFKNNYPNFNYESDDLRATSINYMAKNVKSVKYEYDIKKAYFNVAYNIIDSKCPVFTCFDIWTKYNKEDEINDMYYYLISKKSLKSLKQYGINDNFRTGRMINLLMKHDLIKKSDIQYYKKPSYALEWGTVKTKINKLIIKHIINNNKHLTEQFNNYCDNKREEDKDKDKDKDNSAYINEFIKTHELYINEYIQENKINKHFVFYNGILGKLRQCVEKKIGNVSPDDYELLNYGLDDELWTYDKDEDFCTFTMNSKPIFRNINTTNIYTHIVEETSIYLLKVLFDIKDRYGLMPLKIKVDALGYEEKITLSEQYEQYFKTNTEKIYKKYMTFAQTYKSGKKIINNIIDELKDIKKNNISYSGAPGCGKTYTVSNNHEYNLSATNTNVCALNMSTEDKQATTIYSLLKLYCPDKWLKTMKELSYKTIWIDEYSMINRYIWNFFIILCKKYNTKLIISGDLNQIGPINDTKLSRDNIIFDMLLGNETILETDYRNDEEIIKLRNFVLNNEGRALYTKFKYLKTGEDWRQYNRHIVSTHRMRKYVNNEIMNKHGYKFKLKDNGDYVISKGVILSCRRTKKKKGIYKNDLWRVEKRVQYKENKKNVIGFRLYNFRSGVTTNFKNDDMIYFKLGFAVTAHSAQGLTITEDVVIHQIKKMIWMDKDILYTSITRAKEYNKLHFNYDEDKIPDIKEDLKKIEEDDIEFNKLPTVETII